MDEIWERAMAQLGIIEHVYSIEIQNKEEIARLIAKHVTDKRQVLAICTSLNSWIAGNNVEGKVAIPLDAVFPAEIKSNRNRSNITL
jgi:hypothetical protein